MKKITLLILFCVSVCFFQKAVAQSELPEVSTSENPIWHYIQVVGTDATRKDKVFSITSSDGYYDLYAVDLSTLTTTSRKNLSLFRFEKNADGSYKIIHRSTNRELDIRTKASSTIGTVVDNSSLSWKLNAYNNAYQILSSDGKYLFVGGSTVDYDVTTSTLGTSNNALFKFLVYNNTTPEISDTTDVWYYIYSGQTGNKNKCITDVNETGSGVVKFTLTDKENNNNAQQWKVIKPTNDTNSTLHFVNRATGNIIQTAYDFTGYFNAKSTTDVEKSNGWKLTFIDFDQFRISGLDNTGTTGYLNASSTTERAELIPSSSNFVNSAYAWRFKKVDSGTSIDKIETNETSNLFDNVKVENKRIIVEGIDNYTISHISGISVQKNIELPVGVYLVTINGKTKSYLVK